MKYGSLERTVSAQLCTSSERTYSCDERIQVAKLPFELFLCAERGGFSVEMNGTRYDAREEEAILIPYDTEYTLEVSAGGKICCAGVGLCVYENLRVFSLFELPTVISGDDGASVTRLCREICALYGTSEFTNARLENAVKLNAYTYELCRAVLEKSLPFATNGDIMARHEKLAKVLMYIGSHITDNIMQAELSDLLSMSPDSFYRLFKNYIGLAPKDFIISEKLRFAREMLAMTDMPIGEISKLVGYDNQLYFSSLFRKKYNICPTEYKKAVSRIL